MATKNKATEKSAPKAAKTTSPLPAQVKKGAVKATKSAAPSPEPTPVEASKASKTASKAKSKPQTEVTESAQIIVPKPAGKPPRIDTPKAPAAAGQATPQVTADSPQDQKWGEIRLILEKLKDDALREIRKSVKNGTEAVAAIEPGGDIYDQASSERDRELGLLLGDREREKIHSIDEALLRIDEGDYGICEECDEDIPLGRLKAMPFTRHCVKCKSDLEKLQAQTKRVEEERAYREIPLGAEEEES
jgi:DnaK suppressor protein